MEEGVLVMVTVTAELLPLISTGEGRCCCCVVFTVTKAELHWGHYWGQVDMAWVRSEFHHVCTHPHSMMLPSYNQETNFHYIFIASEIVHAKKY